MGAYEVIRRQSRAAPSILAPSGKWELHYDGGFGKRDKWIYGGIQRYPFAVSETSPSSCRVTLRDTQDSTISAGFDLPETPASVLHEALAAQGQSVARGPVVAKFSPGLTAIRVYRDGTIESKMHGSGSIIGATARIDQSGSERILRDTRQAFLTIEGPHVAISAKLGANSGSVVGAARKFAATINQLAQQLGPAAASAPAASAPAPAEISIPDQIGKLAELRDKGALTEDEFEAKKAELLKRI